VPLARTRRLLLYVLLGREGAAVADPAVLDLLRLVGTAPGDAEHVADHLVDGLAAIGELGVGGDAAPTLIQAYARAVSRIAGAEAEVIEGLLHAVPEDERATRLHELLGALMPVSERGFSVLHEALLHDALIDALTDERLAAETEDAATMSVALVDVMGSTAHLVERDGEGLELMVDALFEAGQRATAGRAAHPLKYVGDGVFIAGREPRDVAQAALDAIRHIERALDLRARGGLAHGRALRRAGDVFGLPMNVSQLLTKVAPPGKLLADADAAALLPARMRGKSFSVQVHVALPELNVTQVRRR
jgi:class 3 adenylate cyclase